MTRAALLRASCVLMYWLASSQRVAVQGLSDNEEPASPALKCVQCFLSLITPSIQNTYPGYM